MRECSIKSPTESSCLRTRRAVRLKRLSLFIKSTEYLHIGIFQSFERLKTICGRLLSKRKVRLFPRKRDAHNVTAGASCPPAPVANRDDVDSLQSSAPRARFIDNVERLLLENRIE